MREETPPKFSKKDIKRLEELDLLPEQIERLEHKLIYIANIAIPVAPMAGVRDELGGFLLSLKDVKKRISAMLSAQKKENNPARYEARVRIELTDMTDIDEMSVYGPDVIPTQLMESTLDKIDLLERVADDALNNLPRVQARNRIASPDAIRLLKNALDAGFQTHHLRKNPDSPLPPYEEIKISASEGSIFREIARICYQAAGHQNHDPRRAIEQYLKASSERTNEGRKRVGLPTINRKRGRPKE